MLAPYVAICIMAFADVSSEVTQATGIVAKENAPVVQQSATPATSAPEEVESTTNPQAEERLAEPTSPRWLLRYKFHEGQTLLYETRQKMTLEVSGELTAKVDVSELRQRRLFTTQVVKSDGSAVLAMQFEHVWMSKTVDNQEPLEFDTAMKSADVPHAFRHVAHQLKGRAPKYWLSTLGLSNYPLSKSIVSDKAHGKTGTTTEKPISLVEGDSENNKIQLVSVSDDNSTDLTDTSVDPGSFVMTLPEKELKVGDTWKESISLPVRLQQDINIQVMILRTFRLESVNNGIAKISFRCSSETPNKSVVVASQLIQATPHGSVTFDINRGIMLHREMLYDASVFNAFGPNTLLTSVGTNTEEFIEPR